MDKSNNYYIKEERIRRHKLLCFCLMTGIMANGCASTMQSTLLGFGTGAVVGAASGAILNQEDKVKSALVTALIMGTIGGISGYFTQHALEDRDASVRKDTLFNMEKFGVSGFCDTSSPEEPDGIKGHDVQR